MPDSLFAIVMLHLQITQEERYLANTLGTPYHAYCRQVFRYLGQKIRLPEYAMADGRGSTAGFWQSFSP